jgi:hypothetical protein
VIKDVQEEELLFRDKKTKKAAQEADVKRDGAAAAGGEETAHEGTVKVEKIGSARFY